MIPKLTINIAHLPDRENPVAEIWCDETQFGELSCEAGGLRFEIYPNSSGRPWRFAFEDLAEVLDQAKIRLAEVTGAVF